MELELPRLLAPDLPSIWYSLKSLNCTHSDCETCKDPVSLFLVTTSPNWYWVIFVPAAFLRCGSRFSGSLSGTEPWFSVTRCNHGTPLPYHRQLIGQIFERNIASNKAYAIRTVTMIRLWIVGFCSNKYCSSTRERSNIFSCISSRITTDIHLGKLYDQVNNNWFNEPFAVSLCIMLILTHAWLNLWDEHMTTGRINQVTIVKRNSKHVVFNWFFSNKYCTHTDVVQNRQRVTVREFTTQEQRLASKHAALSAICLHCRVPFHLQRVLQRKLSHITMIFTVK